jgi:hypothetical protein
MINHNLFEITSKNKILFEIITDKNDIELLQKYIVLFGRDILKNDDLFTYHFILYCLWWVSNNDEGINKYYEGINEVFYIINKYLTEDKQNLINTAYVPIPNPDSFENLIFKITEEPFKIYNQEQSDTFCDSTAEKIKYPDCGETTVRNFINLICFKDNRFDITILEILKAIPELIEYYRHFNNFEIQSSINKIDIYGLKLNARDAWSKLIIEYAKNNINFVRQCTNNHHNYELNARLTIDGSTSNFFQLIKNLLTLFTKWDDIKINDIIDIEDKTVDGVGIINIEHEIYNNIIIHCLEDHYYMEINFKNNNEFNIDLYSGDSLKYNNILILLKEINNITIDNYLCIKYDTNLLVNKFNDESINNNLKLKLFELSLTNQFDNDTRRRINIDVDNSEFFNYIVKISENHIINDYTYLSTDFNFLKNIAKLTHLNSNIKNKNLTSINLSGLSSLTSIGDSFLSNCARLINIDLSGLSNLTSFGDNFLYGCENLTNIDLSGLSNITSIGNHFLHGCKNLTNIDLSGLLNITSIGNHFLHGCENLSSIDLSGLSNLTSIGNWFLYRCNKLTSIDLSRLSNLISIGDEFLYHSDSLKSIDLSGLSNVISIGYNFLSLSHQSKLKSIDLSPLSNLKSIERFDPYLKNKIKYTSNQLDILRINNQGIL